VRVWLLNDELARKLKSPLGLLIRNDSNKIYNVLSEIKGCSLLVSVGDATLDFLISINVVPDIQIIDMKEKRSPRSAVKPAHRIEYHVTNPRGCISEESVKVFNKALGSDKPVRILVEGEDDLLALVAIIFSPEGSCILYGQPDEGLVIVKVDESIRNWCKEIFSSMTLSEKA